MALVMNSFKPASNYLLKLFMLISLIRNMIDLLFLIITGTKVN